MSFNFYSYLFSVADWALPQEWSTSHKSLCSSSAQIGAGLQPRSATSWMSGCYVTRYGILWLYSASLSSLSDCVAVCLCDVFFVCVSTATSGNGCSDALLLWGLTPVQGTLFDTPRPFRYESQNRFRQRQISATSFEHCHGSIAQLSFQQGPDGALCNSLCWNTPEGSRRHATCC